MDQLCSDDLWPVIERLAGESVKKQAAVAYVTTDRLVRFGRGDVLITDASDQSIAAGQTSARIISEANNRGAQVYSLPGLHAKILLLDGVAVIGSANVSESSATSLVEAAWITDNPVAVGLVNAMLQQFIGIAQPVDEAFINRISDIEVAPRISLGSRRQTTARITIPRHQSWIIGVHALVRDFPDEEPAIESGNTVASGKVQRESSDVSWLRWTGKSRFRNEAKPGDSVIQIWSPRRRETPELVYRHAPILHRQDEATCTRFFIEEFADCEETTMGWEGFQTLVAQIKLPGKIGPSCARPVAEAHSAALFSLWGMSAAPAQETR
jgi:hypothetical protein